MNEIDVVIDNPAPAPSPTPVPPAPTPPAPVTFTAAQVAAELQAITKVLTAINGLMPASIQVPFGQSLAFLNGIESQPWVVDMLVYVLNGLANLPKKATQEDVQRLFAEAQVQCSSQM